MLQSYFYNDFAMIGLWLSLVFWHPFFTSGDVEAANCVWDRNEEFGMYPPLLINLDDNESILPTSEGTKTVISIAEGIKFLVACPGTTILASGDEMAEAICADNNNLQIGCDLFTMKEVSCSSRVKETISDNYRPCQLCSKKSCSDYYSIGYNLRSYGFYDLIQFRFDPEFDATYWTVHQLRGENVASSEGNPTRPSFKTDKDFYSSSPNSLYQQNSQMEMMTNIFGNSDYIDVSKSLYFARGHLSPDADFLSEMEADATYQYVNVVPQWQAFNNGNWKALESSIRNLAEDHKTDLHIWTGTKGVLSLKDVNGNEKEIFLGLVEGEKIIPAPEFMWKIVYEPSSSRSVVVIGSNNPYLEEFPSTFCPDVCDQINWIRFDTKVLTKGATFCCSVEEFVKAMPSLNQESFVNTALLVD